MYVHTRSHTQTESTYITQKLIQHSILLSAQWEKALLTTNTTSGGFTGLA